MQDILHYCHLSAASKFLYTKDMTSLPITLPDGFVSTVNAGDVVIIGQVIATKKNHADEIINIPKALSIKRNHVKKVLRKIPGEEVNEGDIIAVKNNLFGTSRTTLRSRVSGTIVRFERNTGNLIIRKSGGSTTPIDMISPVEGTVALCDNKRIVINTDKNVLTGIESVGRMGQGEVFILFENNPFYLDASAIGKIVVGNNFTREMLIKGVSIGVAGIITGNIENRDFEYLKEKGINTPIIKIDAESLEKIKGWNEKKVHINPETNSVILLQL